MTIGHETVYKMYVPIVTQPFGIASNIVHTHNRLPIDFEEKNTAPE